MPKKKKTRKQPAPEAAPVPVGRHNIYIKSVMREEVDERKLVAALLSMIKNGQIGQTTEPDIAETSEIDRN